MTMAERPSELLPCPFCGGDAEYSDVERPVFVRCAAAGCCEGPFNDFTAADAAAAWNRRARTLDAAPSEPSAEHWRRAVEQWKAKHGWYVGDRLQAVCEVEALASELAKESRRDG